MARIETELAALTVSLTIDFRTSGGGVIGRIPPLLAALAGAAMRMTPPRREAMCRDVLPQYWAVESFCAT